MSETVHCELCGVRIPATAAFCKACGARQPDAAPAAAAAPGPGGRAAAVAREAGSAAFPLTGLSAGTLGSMLGEVKWRLASAGLLVVGGLGPWATFGGQSVSIGKVPSHFGGPWMVVLAGLAAVGCVVLAQMRIVGAAANGIVGAIAAFCVVVALLNFLAIENYNSTFGALAALGGEQASLSIGWGLILTCLGSLCLSAAVGQRWRRRRAKAA
jgi:hypothetical protein